MIDGWKKAPGDRVAHFYAKSKKVKKWLARSICGKTAAWKVLELCSTYERDCKTCKDRLGYWREVE